MMKNLSAIRCFAAMSLVAAFMFLGCSDDSSPVVSDEEPVTLSSSDVSDAESSSSAKQEGSVSSSSKKEEKSSSSDVGDVVVPIQKDIYITASELSSRISGDDVRFKGLFGLNFVGDSTVKDSAVEAFFTSIRFIVGKGSDVNGMAIVPVFINSDPILSPAKNFIDLNSMNSAYVSINLLDPGFNGECGVYSLIVTVTASDGEREFMRTEVIPFERETTEYCSEEKSSSSVAQNTEIPMNYCEVEISTNNVSGLNLATCTAIPASDESTDIFFSKARVNGYPEVTAIAYNGNKIAPIINGDDNVYTDDYEVDIWPENMNADRVPAVAYVSDFKFKIPDPGTTIISMIENSNRIYVALAPGYSTETGKGFYAFAITEYTELNDGEYALRIKVYRAN